MNTYLLARDSKVPRPAYSNNKLTTREPVWCKFRQYNDDENITKIVNETNLFTDFHSPATNTVTDDSLAWVA